MWRVVLAIGAWEIMMMNNPIPYYINEHQSDIRAIKDGWYAMDHEGHLSSGPFSSHDECLKKMSSCANGR
jgi:hypothetical protein